MIELHWENAQHLKLYAVHWPASEPKAVIALVHGQGEHIRRYDHVAAWYNRHNVAVVGFDMQGHGRSAGKRGHAPNVEVLLDDIGLLLQQTRTMYPELPVFLYGHSMGGGLALNYMTRRTPEYAGLIATSPWIRLAFEAPAFKVIAGKILKVLMPSLTLPTGLAAHFISHNAEVVKAYKADPLVHDKMSASAGIALLNASNWVDSWSGDLPVPLLLHHGTGDKITSAPATQAFAMRVSGNVTYREWPGLYHEIHNEAEQEAMFTYTLHWMEQVLGHALAK